MLSPVTYQISQSRLNEAYHDTNNLLISPFTDRLFNDYREVVTTLLDNAPPGTEELREEGGPKSGFPVRFSGELTHPVVPGPS